MRPIPSQLFLPLINLCIEKQVIQMLMSNKDVSGYILQGQHKGANKVIQVLLKRTFLSFAQRFVRLDGLNAEFPLPVSVKCQKSADPTCVVASFQASATALQHSDSGRLQTQG